MVSQFGEDWYIYNFSNGNMTANSENGWLVRSAEGDSYARLQVNEFDFPTRTGEGIKSFRIDFDVQPSAQSTFSGRDIYLRTNSGSSGDGDGGAFGAFEWTDLEVYTSATVSPGGESITHHYEADTSSGIFTDSSWYAYNLQGAHKLWPNYRVYLIDTDSTDDASPIYAMQVTGYYNDSGESGHPAIRWMPVELTTAN